MNFFRKEQPKPEPEEDLPAEVTRSENAKEFLLAIITARDESFGEFVNIQTIRQTVSQDVQMAVMYADELQRVLDR